MKKPRRPARLSRPRVGRNAALRAGGGAHTPQAAKRASDKRRREIEAERDEPAGS